MISIMAVGAASMSILAGCQASGTKASNSTTAAAQTEQSSTAEASSETEKTADNTENTGNGSGRTLVVYYSASGNTERVAKAAAEAAGADLFEIVPVEPYTSEDLNWTNDNSRVSREHNDESLRDVELTSTEVANWDSYDTVLIGYPIWWGIAAWPTDGFVKANDFTGKTVIPFCTAASSGIGQSGKLLADLAGTGDWQEGKRFASSASDQEVASWIGELGLSTE